MNRKIIMVILTIIISIGLGISTMITPKPETKQSENFSAERAKEDIDVIGLEPHSVTDQEPLKKVREYLITRLKELGLQPEVFTYPNISDKYGWTYDINNVYAKIDGKNGEDGSYIMLVAHYDSSPKKRAGEEAGSHGAADDGYGLSTILDVLQVIKESNKPLENGIKILFTDAEETGLLGANLEMTKNAELYKNVGFVINLEARGIKGPAVMFETSKNNEKVIELFTKGNRPVSYSLATDVYRKMPNGSDFTEFIQQGLPGINIAVLDSLDYYHTKRDNPSNINLSSIQHYGEQVLPIVKEYIYNDKYSDVNYFKGKQDKIYFTFLPNLTISYSKTMGIILAFFTVLLTIMVIFKMINRDKVSLKSIGKWVGIWLGMGIGALLFGIGISYLLSWMYGITFNLTYMPKIPIANAVALVTIIAIGWWITKYLKMKMIKGESLTAILGGAMLVQAFLLIIFMLLLPGGSFLFLWSLLFTCILFLVLVYTESYRNKIKNLVLIPAGINLIIFAPILYLLLLALTIGALGIILFLAVTAFMMIIPLFYLYQSN